MAASGFLSLPKDEIKTMIANTAAFQTWTGAANATAAKAYIHVYEDDPASGQTRYCMIDDHPQAGIFDRVGSGTDVTNFSWLKGSMFAFYEHVTAFSEANAEDFDNTVSDILTEVLQLAGNGTYRPIDRVRSMRGELGELLTKWEGEVDGSFTFGYRRVFTEEMRPA